MKYLSAILMIMISGAGWACTPVVVTPNIEYVSYRELKETEPDCTRNIEALEQSANNPDELVLEALFCYRSVWKHWENNYRVIDAGMGVMNEYR